MDWTTLLYSKSDQYPSLDAYYRVLIMLCVYRNVNTFTDGSIFYSNSPISHEFLFAGVHRTFVIQSATIGKKLDMGQNCIIFTHPNYLHQLYVTFYVNSWHKVWIIA